METNLNNKVRALLLGAAIICVATASGQGTQVAENRLLPQIRKEFQRINPRISETSVLETSPYRSPAGVSKYVLVAYGIAGREADFRGNFWDEVFGFFVADRSLMTIEIALDIVATPRWRDYRFRIQSMSEDSVTVRGAGETYGDQPREFKFRWNPLNPDQGHVIGALDQIPAPKPGYMGNIRDAKDWPNPYIIVCQEGYVLNVPGRPRGEERYGLIVLEKLLLGLPRECWPLGRVVAVQEQGIRANDLAVQGNLEALLNLLNSDKVKADRWPSG